MTMHDLKVDWDHISPTMNRAKEITFRYDDEKYIHEGDKLRLMDPDGEVFAVANVLGTIHMTPEEFIKFRFKYYKDISLSELLDMMNEYYNDPIRRDTECKVIKYEISAIIGDYYDD